MPEHQKRGNEKTESGRNLRQERRIKDISGEKFGRLTALYPTDRRDEKGSVYWHCRCDCGNEVDVTEDGLTWGNNKSCGCRKRETQERIHEQLHHVEGTCVEILEKRKHRSDNTSGFRGVYPAGKGKFKAAIRFQGKYYSLGTHGSFEEAVMARLSAEETLHGNFLRAYYAWKERAEKDPEWGEAHPFYFRVEKRNGGFKIIRKREE